MAKKLSKTYDLITPDENHKITVGSIVGVKTNTLSSGTSSAKNSTEVWFGFVEQNREQVIDSDLPDKWKANIDGVIYIFDDNGQTCDGRKIQLYLAAGYSSASGTAGGTGFVDEGTEKTVTIANGSVSTRFGENSGTSGHPMTILRPKDQFALAALQGILSGIPNPLGLTYGNILLITEIAYTFGQTMFDKAKLVRDTVTNAVSNDGEVYVNPKIDLDEVSDVVNHNISVNLKLLNQTLTKYLNPLRIDNAGKGYKYDDKGHLLDPDGNIILPTDVSNDGRYVYGADDYAKADMQPKPFLVKGTNIDIVTRNSEEESSGE